jgi:hypothetical protein
MDEEKFRSIGGEKFWFEAIEYASNSFIVNRYLEYPRISVYLSKLHFLVLVEINHSQEQTWYAKKFIEDWRKMHIEESGEEFVKWYEENKGSILERIAPLKNGEDMNGTPGQFLKRFKLLVEFGMNAGVFSLKETEKDFETIVSVMNFQKNDKIKNNDSVKKLSEYILEDREDQLKKTDAMTWSIYYASYLEALKNHQLDLKFYRYSEGYNKGETDSFFSFIKTKLLRQGMVSVIFGKAGTGKSHFLAWVISRILVMFPNWDIYTNLPFFWYDHKDILDLSAPNVYKIDSMSEMLFKSAKSVLNHRQPVVILDEMDQVLTSRRWNSKENISWEVFMNIERHLKIRGPLLVYHITKAMPDPIRNRRITDFIYTLSFSSGERYLFDCFDKKKFLISGFVIPYSTFGTFSFQIDVDMGKLLRSIQTTEIMESAQFIIDHIDEFKFDVKKEIEKELNEVSNTQEIIPEVDLIAKNPEVEAKKNAEKFRKKRR